MHGRDLPWRTQHDPYKVLVSEVMLQQTQVDRVIPKYSAFIERFPTFQALSEARLQSVLVSWQGLGYNRRAKYLHALAGRVMNTFHGRLPCLVSELESLPGIGPATARSIAAFAFNQPVVFIETNVRTVFLYAFFKGRANVGDAELLPFVEQTLDRDNPRRWYNALMDYGTHVKLSQGNQNVRSKHYVKQSVFEGSNRQVRGAVIRHLTEHNKATDADLLGLEFESDKIKTAVTSLLDEGFIVLARDGYEIC